MRRCDASDNANVRVGFQLSSFVSAPNPLDPDFLCYLATVVPIRWYLLERNGIRPAEL
jgi:hypothetical protein